MQIVHSINHPANRQVLASYILKYQLKSSIIKLSVFKSLDSV